MEKKVFKISKSTFAFFSTSCIHTMFRNMTCHSAGIYRGAPPTATPVQTVQFIKASRQ